MASASGEAIEVVARIVTKTFSEKQLKAINLLSEFEGKTTITKAKLTICNKIKISESTFRRIINYLYEDNFILPNENGSPFFFSENGEILVRGCGVALAQRSPKPPVGVQLPPAPLMR